MSDLQGIYGVDAQTLAGITQGRLPKRLIAAGKFGKEDKGDKGDPGQYTDADNVMRSTQNTFAPKSQMKSKLRSSDAQSNMFSFNGYGTGSKWNGKGMQSRLGRGGDRDREELLSSQQDMIASKFNDQEEQKRKPAGKMTSTQMKFGGYSDNRGSSGDSRGGFNNKLKGKNNFV